ncbi:short-chain dehydrogenase [Pseudoalteromonas porphyrae]|uniref:SDR family NAD(P)-dependent oxidoreductase n=1 Tax=Pseudoalteromonas TaxID=53246 RepID=UPI0006BA93BC|nr:MULTISPECIES: SDR family oxidoreductase [Pseudoalteromonas]KPH94731.1 short-chain dehydrogenase [Pseudoalteromonas porphyrae]
MKIAFVSGATSGIGLAFAKELSALGYSLILHGRSADKLTSMARILPSVRLTLVADLANDNDIKAMLEELEKQKLVIDIAINNAGFGLYGKHLALKVSDINAMIAVNISALTTLTHYFAEHMTQHGRGHILNVASTGAYQPQAYMAAYCATKAYVASFSEAIALEVRADNVTVTCLSPGRTDTNFFVFDGADTSKNNKGTFSAKHRISANKVAKLGLKALFKGKIREIPLFENKFYVFLNRILPRSVVLKIYENAMKSI